MLLINYWCHFAIASDVYAFIIFSPFSMIISWLYDAMLDAILLRCWYIAAAIIYYFAISMPLFRCFFLLLSMLRWCSCLFHCQLFDDFHLLRWLFRHASIISYALMPDAIAADAFAIIFFLMPFAAIFSLFRHYFHFRRFSSSPMPPPLLLLDKRHISLFDIRWCRHYFSPLFSPLIIDYVADAITLIAASFIIIIFIFAIFAACYYFHFLLAFHYCRAFMIISWLLLLLLDYLASFMLITPPDIITLWLMLPPIIECRCWYSAPPPPLRWCRCLRRLLITLLRHDIDWLLLMFSAIIILPFSSLFLWCFSLITFWYDAADVFDFSMIITMLISLFADAARDYLSLLFIISFFFIIIYVIVFFSAFFAICRADASLMLIIDISSLMRRLFRDIILFLSAVISHFFFIITRAPCRFYGLSVLPFSSTLRHTLTLSFHFLRCWLLPLFIIAAIFFHFIISCFRHCCAFAERDYWLFADYYAIFAAILFSFADDAVITFFDAIIYWSLFSAAIDIADDYVIDFSLLLLMLIIFISIQPRFHFFFDFLMPLLIISLWYYIIIAIIADINIPFFITPFHWCHFRYLLLHYDAFDIFISSLILRHVFITLAIFRHLRRHRWCLFIFFTLYCYFRYYLLLLPLRCPPPLTLIAAAISFRWLIRCWLPPFAIYYYCFRLFAFMLFSFFAAFTFQIIISYWCHYFHDITPIIFFTLWYYFAATLLRHFLPWFSWHCWYFLRCLMMLIYAAFCHYCWYAAASDFDVSMAFAPTFLRCCCCRCWCHCFLLWFHADVVSLRWCRLFFFFLFFWYAILFSPCFAFFFFFTIFATFLLPPLLIDITLICCWLLFLRHDDYFRFLLILFAARLRFDDADAADARLDMPLLYCRRCRFMFISPPTPLFCFRHAIMMPLLIIISLFSPLIIFLSLRRWLRLYLITPLLMLSLFTLSLLSFHFHYHYFFFHLLFSFIIVIFFAMPPCRLLLFSFFAIIFCYCHDYFLSSYLRLSSPMPTLMLSYLLRRCHYWFSPLSYCLFTLYRRRCRHVFDCFHIFIDISLSDAMLLFRAPPLFFFFHYAFIFNTFLISLFFVALLPFSSIIISLLFLSPPCRYYSFLPSFSFSIAFAISIVSLLLIIDAPLTLSRFDIFAITLHFSPYAFDADFAFFAIDWCLFAAAIFSFRLSLLTLFRYWHAAISLIIFMLWLRAIRRLLFYAYVTPLLAAWCPLIPLRYSHTPLFRFAWYFADYLLLDWLRWLDCWCLRRRYAWCWLLLMFRCFRWLRFFSPLYLPPSLLMRRWLWLLPFSFIDAMPLMPLFWYLPLRFHFSSPLLFHHYAILPLFQSADISFISFFFHYCIIFFDVISYFLPWFSSSLFISPSRFFMSHYWFIYNYFHIVIAATIIYVFITPTLFLWLFIIFISFFFLSDDYFFASFDIAAAA